MGNLPARISREQLLDPEGELLKYRKNLAWSVLERAMLRRKLDGLSVRSAEITLDRYEPALKRTDEPERPTTINVVILSTEALGHQAAADRLGVRLVGGNGDEA